MKKNCRNTLASPRRRQTGRAGAFTVTELLVVLGMTALLASVLLSASFTTQDRVLRAECASNLKKIGSAVLIYAGENNDFFPIESWKNPPPTGTGNPWQTYEACRFAAAGSKQIVEGPYGLGLLFFGKEVADTKTFYCPSVLIPDYAYATYSEASWPWPSIPPDYALGNPYVRCSYSYYPQPKATEVIYDPNFGPFTVPLLASQSMVLVSPNPGDPAQGAHNYPVPLKTSDVNPSKAVSCDVLQTWNTLSHETAGQPAGVNALFGDGHVNWVPVRGNNKKGSFQPFDPKIWNSSPAIVIGNDPTLFRIIVNGLAP